MNETTSGPNHTPRSVGGRWGLDPNTARLVAAELRQCAENGLTPADLLDRADEVERDWS